MGTKEMSTNGHPWRDGLVEMLQHLSVIDDTPKWAMVEIGTYLGEGTSIFARRVKHVYTVDPWDLEFMRSVSGNPDLECWEIFREYHANTEGQDNITLINAPSLLAARRFEDRSLDLVYIDSWHRVIPCVVDIITWLPKIRDGGYIGGHDYTTKDYSEVIPATMYTLGRPDKTFADGSWITRIPHAKD